MAWPEPPKSRHSRKVSDSSSTSRAKKADSNVVHKQKLGRDDLDTEKLAKSKNTSNSSSESAPRKRAHLEGVTLLMMLEYLEERYGWDDLATRIRINCFAKDPSIKSSLKFLRRTPWARKKVEQLYSQSVMDE